MIIISPWAKELLNKKPNPKSPEHIILMKYLK